MGPRWRSSPTIDLLERPATAVNRPGFGHIAFSVEDVAGARDEVLAAGGRPVGEVVTVTLPSGAQVTWCYVTDPEGNVIELQVLVEANAIYYWRRLTRTFDERRVALWKQGRGIGGAFSQRGHEAIGIGAGCALGPDDDV